MNVLSKRQHHLLRSGLDVHKSRTSSMFVTERGLISMVHSTVDRLEIRRQVRLALSDFEPNRLKLAAWFVRIQNEALYRDWGFHSFVDYVEHECDLAEWTVASLINVHEVLVAGHGITEATIERIGWSKAYLMAIRLRKRDMPDPDRLPTLEESLEVPRSVLRDFGHLASIALKDVVRSTGSGTGKVGVTGLLEPDIKASEPTVGHLEGRPASVDPEILARQEAERQAYLRVIAGQILLAPRQQWPELPSQFVVASDVWQQLCFAVDAGKNALIIGPSGCGKTELVRHCAQLFGRQLEVFNFGAMTEPRTSLIGATHFDPARGTFFGASRFVRSLQIPGQVILLDELNRCQPDVYNILLPILDGQRYLALDEQEGAPLVHLAPGVCFFATANVGNEYPGIEPIDKALKDRFPTVIPMWFPEQLQEAALLMKRVRGLSNANATILARFASQQRQQWHEGEFSELVSTRALLATADQVVHGFDLTTAIRFCIINHFSDEGGEQSDRTKLKQLLQRLI